MIEVRNSPQAAGRCCPLCEGSNFQELHRWPVGHPRNPTTLSLAFWQCRCSLALLHPVPRSEHFLSPEGGEEPRGLVSQALRRIRETIFGTPPVQLVRQATRLVSHGRLLDVGGGDRELLEVASRRFQCVSLSPDSFEATPQGHGVKLNAMDWSQLEAQSFDLATMCGSLHRAGNPVQTLFEVNRVLRFGGVVAVRTPKLFGPSHRQQGGNWDGVLAGRHRFLFTAESLRLIMAATGFAPLSSPLRDRPWDDVLVVWGRKVRECEEAFSQSSPGPENTRQAA